MRKTSCSCEFVFLPDGERGAGHGLISCVSTDSEWESALASLCITEDSHCQLLLKRPSTGMCLGTNGWQDFDERLELDFACQGTALRLHVDPSIVDFLENQAVYQLRLFLSTGSSKTGVMLEAMGGLAPRRIMYSRDPSLLSPLEEKQSQKKEILEPVEKQPLALSPQAPTPAQSAPLDFPSRPVPHTRSSIKYFVFVLCLGLLSGAAFWIYQNKDTLPARFSPGTQSVTPAADSSRQDSAPIAYLTMARQALGAKLPSADIFALAKHLLENTTDPKAQDGAFLLLDDAASHGTMEATVLLADFYAPNLEKRGSIPKDPALAKKLYQQALTTQPEAQAKLDALMLWATTEASKGNAEAKKLIP